jgi:hypothetical protein
MAQLLARTVIACALSCSLALGSLPAAAQSAEDVAAARQLAAEGAKLFNSGDYAGALDRFTRAETLYHAPPHVLYQARANVKLGKLVVAREQYLKITKETLAANAPKAFLEAQKTAAEELKTIEPKIGTLEITVKGAPAGAKVEVTIDGTPMSSALIGVSRPADPGTHKIEAKAPGMVGEASVTLAEGGKESVEIELKSATGEPPPKKDEPPPPPPPVDQPSSDGSGLKIVGYTALGVGVVGLALGTVFALSSSSKRSDANALCPNDVCPESKRAEVEDLDNQANSARTMSFVGFGVGVIGVGVGVTMLVISSGKSSTETKTAHGLTVHPYATLGGLGLTGSF